MPDIPEKKPLVGRDANTGGSMSSEELEALVAQDQAINKGQSVPAENQAALQGLSETTTPSTPSYIEALDYSDKKAAMPEGKEWLSRLGKFMEKDWAKGADSEFRHTKFGPALYHGFRLLNTLFGFAFDPGSFNKLSSSLYPTASFDDEMDTILKKRLVERYVKLSGSNSTTVSGRAKKLTQLGKLKARLIELGMTEEEINQLGEKEEFDKRLAQQTTKLNLEDMMEDEEFKKLMETDEGELRADSFASVAYVYRELGAAAPLPKEGQTLISAYDPMSLNSKLQNAQFTDESVYEYNIHGTEDTVSHKNPTMENLYNMEKDRGTVLAAYKAETLPVGTVVFFRRMGVLMTGIVNLDRKIRYHTKEDLSVLDDFSGEDSDGKKVLKLVNDFDKTATKAGLTTKKKVETKESVSGILGLKDLFDQSNFAGAFIPNFGPDTQKDVEKKSEDYVEYRKEIEKKEQEKQALKDDELSEADQKMSLQEHQKRLDLQTEITAGETEAGAAGAEPTDEVGTTDEKKAGDDAKAKETAEEKAGDGNTAS